MTQDRVLIVTAHPDDVAFNMGGTVALMKDRYEIYCVCLTRGELGYEWTGEGPTPPNQALADQRSAEEEASAALINAQLEFYDLPDGHIYADQSACERMAQTIASLQPRAILTMGPYEKPDHAACFQICRHGLYKSERFWETEFYTNLVIGESHNAFNPNIFVNTESVIEHKKAQCYCHQHHLYDETYWDMLLERDQAAGKLAVCKTAEAYFSELSLMASRWGRPAPSLLMDLSP